MEIIAKRKPHTYLSVFYAFHTCYFLFSNCTKTSYVTVSRKLVSYITKFFKICLVLNLKTLHNFQYSEPRKKSYSHGFRCILHGKSVFEQWRCNHYTRPVDFSSMWKNVKLKRVVCLHVVMMMKIYHCMCQNTQ